MLLLPLTSVAFADLAPAPYVGVLGSYLRAEYPDGNHSGYGLQPIVGLPVLPNLNVELSGFANSLTHTPTGGDKIYGVGGDFQPYASFGSMSVFALVGGGVDVDDVAHKTRAAGFVDVGGGLLAELMPHLSLRTELRYYGIFSGKNHGSGHDVIGDARFNIGLQYSFGHLSRAVSAEPQERDLAIGFPQPAEPVRSLDTDGDGVPDSADLCPQTPADTRVDASGCPLVAVAAPVVSNGDSDGDGVPDAKDKCPSTPKGLKVDADGCIVEQTVVLRAINFDTASDHLTEEAKLTLDLLARSMVLQKALTIEIVGHTDSLGPQSLNLQLSQKRAAAVQDYLVAHGVEAERLHAEGLGEFNPIATNNSEAGRAKNRRVEFKVVNAPAK